MDIAEALSQAELCIRYNQTAEARSILGSIIREDPQNEEAWILSAQVSDKPEQVLFCLNRAININPASSRARILLTQLQTPSVASPTLATPAPASTSEPSGPTEEPKPEIAHLEMMETPASQTAIPTQETGSEDTGAAKLESVPFHEPPPLGEPTSEEAEVVTSLIQPPSVEPVSEEVEAVKPLIQPPQSTASTATSLAEAARQAMQESALVQPVQETLDAQDLFIQPEQRLAESLMKQGKSRNRPWRWLQRIFTLAGTACLWVPWLSQQSANDQPRTVSGVQFLSESFHGSLAPDLAIAGLATLVLLVLIFFRFKSGPTQRWGERATIALVPLAALPALELIGSYLTGTTAFTGLLWGLWLNFGFYTLVGMISLINARRIGKMERSEINAARAGRIFTWIFSLGNFLAILVTVAALLLLGRFSLIASIVPLVWLMAGALLSHFA